MASVAGEVVLEGAPILVPAHGGEQGLCPCGLHVVVHMQVADAEGVPRLGGGGLGEPPLPPKDQPVGVALQGGEVLVYCGLVARDGEAEGDKGLAH